MNKQPKIYDSVHAWIYDETKGVVQSGPFVGMLILQDRAWKDSNLAPQCLGCYEEELHPAIEAQIERLAKLDEPVIADIGCAEGYYAVGLGRRLPLAKIYTVDISEESLALARKNAAVNGTKLSCANDLAEVFARPDLLIVDVEGDEEVYLDLTKFPALVRADIIVECHDCEDLDLLRTKNLTEKFAATHNIECIYEGARDPNKFPMLHKRESIHRWMAVCEGRPRRMNWLVMKAKQ
jgi:SAM-dependent methyltransferase